MGKGKNNHLDETPEDEDDDFDDIQSLKEAIYDFLDQEEQERAQMEEDVRQFMERDEQEAALQHRLDKALEALDIIDETPYEKKFSAYIAAEEALIEYQESLQPKKETPKEFLERDLQSYNKAFRELAIRELETSKMLKEKEDKKPKAPTLQASATVQPNTPALQASPKKPSIQKNASPKKPEQKPRFSTGRGQGFPTPALPPRKHNPTLTATAKVNTKPGISDDAVKAARQLLEGAKKMVAAAQEFPQGSKERQQTLETLNKIDKTLGRLLQNATSHTMTKPSIPSQSATTASKSTKVSLSNLGNKVSKHQEGTESAIKAAKKAGVSDVRDTKRPTSPVQTPSTKRPSSPERGGTSRA